MKEFMEQYWSFYNAGVAIFLFAGLALFFKLIFFRRKRHKKEPHLTFKPVSYTHLTLPTNREV